MNTINDDLITIIKDMPQSGINLNVVTIDDRQYYEYRVDFLIDQIAAYAAEIRTMKIDVAYKRVGKTFSLLSGKNFGSAGAINQQIINGNKITTDYVRERNQEQKDSILISKSADIFSKSKKISKFRLQSTKYIDLASVVDNFESIGSLQSNQVTNKIASDLIKDSLSNNTSAAGSTLYSRLTLSGKDPASRITAANLIEDSTSVRKGLGNLIRPNQSIASAFTSTQATSANNNLLSPVLRAQKKQILTSDVVVPYTFRFPSSITFPNGKFSIICTIRKANGDLVQKVDFNINHARQMIEYNLPKALPKTFIQFITKTTAQINVFNKDPRISSIRIYDRDIPSYQTVAEQNRFRNIATISSNWKEQVISARLPIKSTTNKVIRMLPVLSTGIVLGNFDSKSFNVNSEIVGGTVVATSNKGYIMVSLYGAPAKYKYIQFAKRSIDKKQKDWSLIQNPIKVLDGIATVDDSDVFNERTYEYAAFLQDTYGNKARSKSTSLVRSTDYTAGTELIVTQKSKVINGINTTTTFNISVILTKNSDTTAILEATKAQGIDSYFESETLKLAGDLSSITKVNVRRLSLDTGVIKDLGVIEPGECTDTTNENVVYIFEGLLRGQADLFEEIGSNKTSYKTLNPRDALQRSQIVSSELTKTPQISKINYTQKFLSKKSMLRGTLSYGSTKANDIDTSGFLQGRLGITTTAYIERSGSNQTINNFDLIISNENCRLLSFDVLGITSQKNIDFFIISTSRGGVRSVIGTCHHVDDNIRQHFLDDKTRLTTGKVSYIVTPVRYDGSTLSEITTQQFEVM